jgi:hypothetical protein
MLSVGRSERYAVSPLLMEIVMLVEPSRLPPVHAPVWRRADEAVPTSIPG